MEAFQLSLIFIFYSTFSAIFSFLPMCSLVIGSRQLYNSLDSKLRNVEFLGYLLSKKLSCILGTFYSLSVWQVRKWFGDLGFGLLFLASDVKYLTGLWNGLHFCVELL